MSPVSAPARDAVEPLAQRRTSLLLAAQSGTRSADFAEELRRKREDRAEEVGPDRAGPTAASDPEQPEESSAVESNEKGAAPTGATDSANPEGPARGTDSSGEAKDGDRPETGAEAPEQIEGSAPAAVATRPVTIRLLNHQLLQGSLLVQADTPQTIADAAARQPAGGDGRGGTAGSGGAPDSATPHRITNADAARGSSVQAFDAESRGENEARTATRDDGRPTLHDSTSRAEPGAGLPDRGSPRRADVPSVAVKSPAADPAVARASSAVGATGTRGFADPNPASSGARRVSEGDTVAGAAARGEGGGRGGAPVAIASAGVGGRGAGSAGGGSAERAADVRRQPTEGAEGKGAFKAQLVRGLSAALAQARAPQAQSTSEVILRLQPASLGQLKVRVAIDRERSEVSARFEVTGAEARRAVDASLGDLRASLEARGLVINTLDVVLRPRERPLGDPLGLATGTPYARAEGTADGGRAPGSVDPDGGRHPGAGAGGGGPEQGSGGASHHSFDPHRGGHHGPEARPDRGQGSTDAPRSPSIFDDAGAERPIYLDSTRLPFRVGQNEGGALRLTIDALA